MNQGTHSSAQQESPSTARWRLGFVVVCQSLLSCCATHAEVKTDKNTVKVPFGNRVVVIFHGDGKGEVRVEPPTLLESITAGLVGGLGRAVFNLTSTPRDDDRDNGTGIPR